MATRHLHKPGTPRIRASDTLMRRVRVLLVFSGDRDSHSMSTKQWTTLLYKLFADHDEINGRQDACREFGIEWPTRVERTDPDGGRCKTTSIRTPAAYWPSHRH